METILEAIRDRKAEIERIETELSAAEAEDALPADFRVRRAEQLARERLEEVSRVMAENPEKARPVIQALFPEGLVATPMAPTRGRKIPWEIRGEALFHPDLPLGSKKGASPPGFEPGLPP